MAKQIPPLQGRLLEKQLFFVCSKTWVFLGIRSFAGLRSPRVSGPRSNVIGSDSKRRGTLQSLYIIYIYKYGMEQKEHGFPCCP